jgi:hypothetical protein
MLRGLSAMVQRSRLAQSLGITFGGKRDLYETLGYKKELCYNDYAARYERCGVARRVVEAVASSAWRNSPIVRSDAENDPFNEAWDELVERLRLFHYLERADKLAGVGRYAIMLVGVSGGANLKTPISKVNGPENVIYLSVYGEGNADIKEFDLDPASQRFGFPTLYGVKLNGDIRGGIGNTGITTTDVHYSRVVHLADGLAEDEIFGTPRLKAVWNYLDDMDKVVGGASEAIWRIVDRGIQFNIDKDAEMDPEDDARALEDFEDYVHGNKRYLVTQGVEAKVLGSEMADPRGPFTVLSSLISGTTGIPQRVLFGSERGQLASSQDERNYNSRVKERQVSYAEPTVLRPLIKTFIDINALPKPKGKLVIEWPDLSTQTDRERADVAARYAQAIRNVSGKDTPAMDPREFVDLFIRPIGKKGRKNAKDGISEGGDGGNAD